MISQFLKWKLITVLFMVKLALQPQTISMEHHDIVIILFLVMLAEAVQPKKANTCAR